MGLGNLARDVAVVDDIEAERLELFANPRLAEGRRTHVDATAAGAEIDLHTDDSDALRHQKY